MKKIKLLTTPYKFYNQFMPPVALCLISQKLLDNGIEHDKDDLYVKLHYAQKNGSINLDIPDSEISMWENYIRGEDIKEVEETVAKIAGLTNFEDYGILLFSSRYPPLAEIPNHILPLALFRYLKRKYNPLIIINNMESRGKYMGLVDEIMPGSNELFYYLREKLGFDLKSNLKIGTKQNLDGLPLELYRYQGITVAGYYFYDGCPYNCYFCDGFFTQKRNSITRRISLPDPKKVVQEIKEFAGKYGIRNFMFHNTNINATEKFAREIASNIIDFNLDIMWCDSATFKGMTTELLDLLKEAGCIKLVFGFETASKRLQKRINKVIDLAHVEKIIRHCYDIGIWVDLTLLCGLPYETYEDIYETLLFIRKNYRYIRGLNLNRFVLRPSEFLFNDIKHGIIIKKVVNDSWTIGFDEIHGMKWEEKWEYMNKVYSDFINAVDPVKVDFIRPVHHIFRVFSNKVTVSNINRYLDTKVLNNDTTKLDLLIKKYEEIKIEQL